MRMLTTASLLAIFLLMAIHAAAQDFKMGIRAGINLADIVGAREQDDAGAYLENNALRVRIAVAFTTRLQFTDRVGMHADLAFVQKGSYYRYEGASYMKFPELSGQTFQGHKRIMAMNLINGYVEVPISFYYELVDDKFSIDAGVTAGFLVTSRALGTLKYIDEAAAEDLVEYDLDFRYGSDAAGEVVTEETRTGRIAGTTIIHPSSIGAYYFESEKKGNFYNFFDLSFNVGASFYLSPGLRVGTRFQYSLLDISNNQYDRSLHKLNSDGSLIPRTDKDRNIGLQIFLGLQF